MDHIWNKTGIDEYGGSGIHVSQASDAGGGVSWDGMPMWLLRTVRWSCGVRTRGAAIFGLCLFEGDGWKSEGLFFFRSASAAAGVFHPAEYGINAVCV